MIRTFINRPIAVSMIYLTIAALGVAAFRNIPIELLPDTTLPRLSVSSSWAGSSPETVEAFLTAPLEAAIQQVRGVERIVSTSREGNTVIQVWFGRDTDMDFARLELSERLASIENDLPTGARPPVVQMYVPEEFQDQLSAVLEYTVTGPYILEYIREHAEEHIRPELLQIDGVGDIRLSGGRARVLAIELDEARINSLGLRLQEVSSRISGMEIMREAGVVETESGQHRTLTVRQRPESAAEIRDLPLLTDQGRVVRVSDVARVYDTFEEATSHYRIDGNPAVGMSIYKQPRTNTVRMADSVKLAIEQVPLQSGMRLILDSDQSVDIRRQLSDLRNRAMVAAVIVLIVLLIFLGSVRAAVIVFSTVAFAVLITVNILYFADITLNLLTLMGLAMGFGLVVDNAIVVLENIYRRRRRGEAAPLAAERGAREVMLPILAATGTTVVVLVPFVYLQGELRVYYVPLAIVVGLSLIASLFVAFTFIPSLGAKLLGNVKPRDGVTSESAAAADRDGLLPPMTDDSWMVRLYGGLVRGTLAHPVITIVLALIMFGASFYVFDKFVSRGQLWNANWGAQQTVVTISMRMPRGEEVERVDELARFFEERLKRMPEVDRYVTNVTSGTSGSIRVYFPKELELTDVPLAVKEQMYQYSLGYGGAEVRVTGIGPSFYGGGSSAPNYSIKILGYNYERVRDIAEDLGARLTTYSRIRDVDTNSAGSFYDRDRATELVLDIDRARLALHGVTTRDVVAAVSASVRGRSAGSVRVGGEEMQFSVKLAGFDEMDMHQLNQLHIPSATGAGVRLGEVATLTERQVLSTVIRENQQYQRQISYEFRGPPKLGDLIRDQYIDATLLPPGYVIEGRQEWAWSAEEKAQIYGVLAISILLIFMVTAAVFESVKQPMCVLLTVPMALIGVFLMFFYVGASFTREAYVGVIMMGGIVVNNSILLVDHINQLRRVYGLPLAEALERGTLERVRPILMTSLTTICGLLPLVLFSEGADQNIWNALAYSLIGGLSSSTILVLTVTPALYLLFERRAERKRLARIGDEAGVLQPA